MKKWLFFFAAFALVIALSFSSYLYLYRAEFTSATLSKVFGSPVKISKIRVTSRDIELHDLEVYSPHEFTMQPALSVEKIKLKITPLDALKGLFALWPIEIDKVALLDPRFSIECRDSTQNNWQTLLKNINSNPTSTRLYTIKSITLQDISIAIKDRSESPHTLRPESIPTLTLTAPQESPLEPILYSALSKTLSEIATRTHQPNLQTSFQAP